MASVEYCWPDTDDEDEAFSRHSRVYAGYHRELVLTMPASMALLNGPMPTPPPTPTTVLSAQMSPPATPTTVIKPVFVMNQPMQSPPATPTIVTKPIFDSFGTPPLGAKNSRKPKAPNSPTSPTTQPSELLLGTPAPSGTLPVLLGEVPGARPAKQTNEEEKLSAKHSAPGRASGVEQTGVVDSDFDQSGGKSGAEGKFTTVMIGNLPWAMQQSQLLRALDESGFQDAYDFCYLPSSFESGSGMGFAFVNFKDCASAAAFARKWRSRVVSSRPLTISVAKIQGKEANLAKWSNSRLRRIRNPGLKPYVRLSESPPAKRQLPPR